MKLLHVLKWIILLVALLCPITWSAIAEQATSPGKTGPLLELSPAQEKWLKTHPMIRVAGPRASPPFHFFGADQIAQGMAVDYLTYIAKALGLKILPEPEIYWPQVLESARNHEIDLISCIAKSGDRETYLAYTDPLLSFPLVIITRKNTDFVGDVTDLNGKTVAIVKQTAAYDWLVKDHIDFKPMFVDTPLASLKAVSLGRADAHIENLAAAGYLIEQYGLTNLKIAAPTKYGNYNLYMAVRKDWAELVPILNQSLAAISPETHAEIRNRWLSVRYEYGLRPRDILKWGLAGLTLVSVILLVVFLWNRSLRKQISERQRITEELRVSETRYRTLFETMRDGIAIYTPVNNGEGFVFMDFNQAGEVIDRIDRRDVIGRSVLTVFPGIEEFGLLEVLRKVHQTGEPASHPVTFYEDNRITGWRENDVFKLPSGEIVAIYRDETSRKIAEEELRRSEARYRAITDSAEDSIFTKDAGRRYTFVNYAMQKTLGLPFEQLIGKTPEALFDPEAARVIRQVDERTLAGEIVNEIRSLFVNQQESVFHTIQVPLRNEKNDIVGMAGIVRDITAIRKGERERLELQEKLARSQKMEALGVLAGGGGPRPEQHPGRHHQLSGIAAAQPARQK